MFFYDKKNIEEVEKLILNMSLLNSDIFELYKVISSEYPYSGVLIVNNKKYLCVNDLFYTLGGKVDNPFNYIDNDINKSNIKHL